MSGELSVRLLQGFDDVEPAAWDALNTERNPFFSHAFLAGLERHRCIGPEVGWQPVHLTLWREDLPVAGAPLYLKGHSHGEFVFDWAWADAFARQGREYYPKLLCAVPLSPVGGQRLLSLPEENTREMQAALAEVLRGLPGRLGLSSLHVNFVRDSDREALDDAGFLPRIDHQFHWQNPGYASFDEFLQELTSKKRKNIRQERRKVADAGFRFHVVHGDEASEEDFALAERYYRNTFEKKGNWPLLHAEFFADLGRALGNELLFIFAECDGKRRAGAIFFRNDQTIWGRYWGCEEEVPGLHFETCYYQAIEYAIAEKIRCFEPGAQGAHKLARGFLPTETISMHWIDDPEFRAAIADFLRREGQHREAQGRALALQSPFRERETS